MTKPRILPVILIAALVPFLCSPGVTPAPGAATHPLLTSHHSPLTPPPDDGPAYRVPYRISETLHMIVRAKFNGKGPFNFIVDTGAPAIFVTTELAKQVGVEPMQDGWATFDRMELEGGATLEKVKARVETFPQIRGMNAMSLPGVKLDGVLGYTLLARFRMEFDLSNKVMTWTKLDFEPPLPRPLGGDGAQGGSSAPPELEVMAGLVEGFGAMFGRGQPEAAVARGFLGVELADVEGGVQIKSVLPKSPADDAGLKPGDAISEFAGKSVASAAVLLKLAATIAEDEEIRLVVKRDGERTQVTAKTGKGF